MRYKILNEDDSELFVYDVIGYGGVSAKDVADVLQELKDQKRISVRINSPGGDVFDGQAIYSLLNSAQQKIDVKIDGVAASAASVIAMAGDTIEMAAGSQMMIHNAWGVASGFAPELRKYADLLDSVSDQIADVYVARTGNDLDSVKSMMDDETWMTADEAVEKGFATAVTEHKRMAACWDWSKFQYKHVPAAILEPVSEIPKRERIREELKALRANAQKFSLGA